MNYQQQLGLGDETTPCKCGHQGRRALVDSQHEEQYRTADGWAKRPIVFRMSKCLRCGNLRHRAEPLSGVRLGYVSSSSTKSMDTPLAEHSAQT